MNEGKNIMNNISDEKHSCPMCSKTNITTKLEKDDIEYGKDRAVVRLTVKIPVRTCGDCGFQFTDHVAEDLKHEALCRHLGRLTPVEIKKLRKDYNLSRKNFAKLTLIGEASLARWETGELIQNGAYDQFLYLISFPNNLDRLLSRDQREGLGNSTDKNEIEQKTKGRFIALEETEIIENSKGAINFQLVTN